MTAMREHLKAFYLEYLNACITVQAMSDYKHMAEADTQACIDMGRRLHEEDAARAASAPKPDLYGYIALYNGKRHELYASSSARAFDAAVNHFNPPKSKRHMVSVTLAERPDGTTVTHTAVN